MAKKPESDNLLDYIPVRTVAWEENKEGLAVLRVPKFQARWLRNLLGKCSIASHYHCNLDKTGSLIWKCIDGHTDLYHIGKKLKEEYGENIEPVYDRLNEFIRSLYHQKMIFLQKPDVNDE